MIASWLWKIMKVEFFIAFVITVITILLGILVPYIWALFVWWWILGTGTLLFIQVLIYRYLKKKDW